MAEISIVGVVVVLVLLTLAVALFVVIDRASVNRVLKTFGLMAVQMALVGGGVWLVFKMDAWWVNVLWLLVMMVLSAVWCLYLLRDTWKQMMLPVCTSLLAGSLVAGGSLMLCLPGRAFVPVFGVVLALVDKNRTSRTVVFFAVAAVVFWLFSMGRFCEPVYRIVYSLPFGDYLRAPVKWHHLTEFCRAVLAGYGLRSWMSLMSKRMDRRIAMAVAAFLAVGGAFVLACNDRLYCAPHRADADMQFVDGRMLQDPRGVAQLNQMRARVLGTYQGAALIEVPKMKPKDEPAPELPSPHPVALSLGILSLVGTLGVAVGSIGWRKVRA